MKSHKNKLAKMPIIISICFLLIFSLALPISSAYANNPDNGGILRVLEEDPDETDETTEEPAESTTEEPTESTTEEPTESATDATTQPTINTTNPPSTSGTTSGTRPTTPSTPVPTTPTDPPTDAPTQRTTPPSRSRETLDTGTTSSTTGGDSVTSDPSSTQNPDTPTSYIFGPMTTSSKSGKVAVNISFDDIMPVLFGIKEAELLDETKSFFLFYNDEYQRITNNNELVLSILASRSSKVITDEAINKAANDKNQINRVKPQYIQKAIFNLGLVYKNNESGALLPVPDSKDVQKPIVVNLPVPNTMREDGYIVYAAKLEDNGSITILDTTIINQVASFTVNELGTVALIGVPGVNTGSTKDSKIPFLSIIFFSVAGVMLVGALVLIYFYYIRKPKDEDADVKDYTPTGAGSYYESEDVSSDDLSVTTRMQSVDIQTDENTPEDTDEEVESKPESKKYNDIVDAIQKGEFSAKNDAQDKDEFDL